MAGPYYVRSTDGSDASDGLTWANAKATLTGALAVAAAGERIWISHVHAETTAAIVTLTSAGTAASPLEIFCGNDGAEPPSALATTATISTTGASALKFGVGHATVYGVIFQSGSAANAANIQLDGTTSWYWKLEACELFINNTSGSSRVSIGTTVDADCRLELVNCTVRFSAVAQAFIGFVPFEWRGGTLAGTSVTGGLIRTQTNRSLDARVYGVDLSNLGANPLVLVSPGVPGSVVKFENCKLGTTFAATTGTNPGPGQVQVWIDNCSDGDQHYIMRRTSYEGTINQETTNIRTGGATNGTTPIAWRMFGNRRNFLRPQYSPEIVAWNTTTGSPLMVTVEVLAEVPTTLQDDEAWLEVEYPGTSGFPQSAFASDRMATILSTSADQTTSSETWDTSGLATTQKHKLEVTITPQEIGLIRARVAWACQGSGNERLYVDPLLTIG